MSKHAPYPYGSGNRKKGLSAKDWTGILLLGLSLTIAIGIGYWRYTAGKNHISYDRISFCPVEGPYARTVVLIDLTDEISVIQEHKLKNFIHSLVYSNSPDAVPQHSMLSVYLLSEEDATEIPTPAVEVCNPGSGEGISEFTGNPRLANKRFTERFLDPIETAIGKIAHTDTAKISPILESIRAISVSAFKQSPHDGYEHRLIVISDMLQNSPNVSHYRQGQNVNNVDISKLRADLGVVSRIDIKVIERKGPERLQGKALVEFWRTYFRESGSSLSTAERWRE